MSLIRRVRRSRLIIDVAVLVVCFCMAPVFAASPSVIGHPVSTDSQQTPPAALAALTTPSRAWSCTAPHYWAFQSQYDLICSVYVPPTKNRLFLTAHADVANLCGGTEVGVRVDVTGMGTVMFNQESDVGGYTGQDSGTMVLDRSYSGHSWILYAYNRSYCSSYQVGEMTIVEVQ